MHRHGTSVALGLILGTAAGCLIFWYAGFKMQMSLLYSDESSSSKFNDSFLQGVKECGEICSYTAGTVKQGKYYPFITKAVNCGNMMARLVKPPGKVVIPPPRSPPKELYQEFIQFGKAPITKNWYFDEAKGSSRFNKPKARDAKIIDILRERDRKGKNPGFYEECPLMKRAMMKYNETVAGKRGLVIGTQHPWLEAIILNVGAKWVTTSEYGKLFFVHPNINTITPYKLGEEVIKGKVEQFDFAASFSSIEHSGLGRYGDPLNPYGDFEAVAQVWCMVKPGGYFYLGLPTSGGFKTTRIEYNAHRIYGAERLQHLTANWEVVDAFEAAQSVFVLKKRL